MPGTTKIYLYAGMGSMGEFYADLWCFDTAGLYWERMVSVCVLSVSCLHVCSTSRTAQAVELGSRSHVERASHKT